MCQVTSKPYGDPRVVEITNRDFATGGLRVVSYVRPAKLFTAHEALITAQAGRLTADSLQRVREAVLAVLR
jgi:mRNA interferase MazF